MPVGRPSLFTQAVADVICERLVKPESLRSICRDPKMPVIRTVFRWLAAHQDFRDQYALARAIQADVIADETQEIVDDGSNDWMEVELQKGTAIKLNNEAIARSRLRFDQRKWFLAKLAPKKYGDKADADAAATGETEICVIIGGDANGARAD